MDKAVDNTCTIWLIQEGKTINFFQFSLKTKVAKRQKKKDKKAPITLCSNAIKENLLYVALALRRK